jgi:membrane-bound lytic murein transglycosylase MltF
MRAWRIGMGLFVGIVSALLFAAAVFAATQEPASKPAPRQLTTTAKSWTGDFDGMLERRVIRVMVPYSRSLYFNDKGRERGLTADAVRDFERWLNKKYAKQLGKRPLTVYIIPVTRDKLLPDVVSGFGDIASANLTVTEERRKSVDFAVPPEQPPHKELVVTGPNSPAVRTAEDLSGKTVHVRKASSYYESLEALNARLGKEGKPPVKVVPVPDALEDEDMLEMVNAGLLSAIVVDGWKAKMWAQILPKVKVNEEAVLREGAKIGWAIRKGSPKLESEILEYAARTLKSESAYVNRVKQYMRRVKQIRNSTGTEEWKRFEDTLELFQKYGAKYHFDPLMLAAQGFQESQLNQKAKSPVGAIGVMQVMPATGKELNVGDIHVTESNIHAGAKYMDQLMTKFFRDANFDENNRTLFAFASYNAGPGNISKMRKEAAKQGLDADKWFNNVEVVTARRIGIETTTYVRNIFKYYVAYKLQMEVQDAAKKAREQVAPGTGK